MFLGCWGAFFHVVIQGTKTITACGSLFPRTSVSSASLSGNGHRAWRRHAYSLKAMANERHSHFYLHHVGKTGHMAPGTVKGAFWLDNCFPNTISYRRKADLVDSKLPLPQCKIRLFIVPLRPILSFLFPFSVNGTCLTQVLWPSLLE